MASGRQNETILRVVAPISTDEHRILSAGETARMVASLDVFTSASDPALDPLATLSKKKPSHFTKTRRELQRTWSLTELSFGRSPSKLQ